MAALAMWFQDASAGGMSADAQKWIVIFLGVIAFSMLVQALIWIGVGIGALVALKKVKTAVDDVRNDIKTHAGEIKGKIYPVIDTVTHISHNAQAIIADATPKIKNATEHLVETSRVVRESAEKFSHTLRDSGEKISHTVTDANQKTQRQVARVDGMVTAALDTTAEIVQTIEHGIKVPAQKIAHAATQARFIAEGVLDRVKAMASGLPFLQHKGPGSAGPRTPASPAAARPYPPPATRGATTPASATGSVPLIK